MQGIIDFILHIDTHLIALIEQYGAFSYLIVFAIIFCETGLVIAPFLPGDSLLFAVGAISTKGGFNLWIIYPLLILAAILGDACNYYFGHKLGRKAFEKIPFLELESLKKTEKFYEKYGGKTIVLARFLPIVRTLAPFVAGMSKMKYQNFSYYNVIGGIAWVSIFMFMGVFFGNLPFVEKNFSIVIAAILLISIVPPIFEYLKSKYDKKRTENESRKKDIKK